MKKILAWVLALSLLLCGAAFAEEAEEVHVKVGVVGENNEQWEQVIIPTLAEEGIIIELVKFSDYIIPNQALAQGEIDMNAFQHYDFQHYDFMNNWNEENSAAYGVTLVGLCDTFIAPLCIYSDKITSLDELEDGQHLTISIPNDPTNGGRALQLLAANGIITLEEDLGISATPNDITDSPYDVEIIEMAAETIPVNLSEVDLAISNGNNALNANVLDQLLVTEDADGVAQQFANCIAVRSGDEDSQKIQDLMSVLKSQKTIDFINENYNGVVVPFFTVE